MSATTEEPRKLSAAQRDRFIREQQLPEWAWGLPAALQSAILDAGLPNLSIEAVRAFGPANWLRQPNVGRLSLAQLSEAIGGWDIHATPSLPTFSDADLVMEMLRRGYTVRRNDA